MTSDLILNGDTQIHLQAH